MNQEEGTWDRINPDEGEHWVARPHGIRHRIEVEFNRIADCLRTIAARQQARDREHTRAIMGILEQKKVEVLDETEDHDFVRGWQDVGTRVRELLFEDWRYKELRLSRNRPRRTLVVRRIRAGTSGTG